MARASRVLLGLAVAAFAGLMLGFLIFANVATREPTPVAGTADGIIVLTGAEHRIAEGLRLLREGRARRLLISGVNPRTKPEDVRRLTTPGDKLFDCCIDFGYDAQDTIGNA